jgi:hypothetical protein
MAKKKAESGPGPFMILVLVFFILASLILGVTTYMGYNGQEELTAKAAESDKQAKAAQAEAQQQTLRKEVLRVAIGIEDPDDRKDLAGTPKDLVVPVMDEINKLNNKLGAAGMPGGNKAFSMPNAGAEGAVPNLIPNKTLTQIVKEWAKLANDAEKRYKDELAAHKTADTNTEAARAERDAAKKAFDTSVGNLNEQMAGKIKQMDASFLALKTEADKKGLDFKKLEDDWAQARTTMEDQMQAMRNDVVALKDKIRRLENPDPSDLTKRFDSLNVARLAERMGSVSDKNGTFVNLQFQTQIVLLPGQSFVVIPPGRSLAEVIEQEKQLEKHHHDFVSANPREPFTGNELIKGMVEITDVTSKYTARARITYQSNDVRDPISKGDGIFNLSLSSGQKEHVALAGIVDLDGDGRPDTEQFIRLLEKNNLIVDAYLDLKTGQIKERGTGMNSGTRFLILGTDAPTGVGAIEEMVQAAKENGSQIIDSRVFMGLIGIKPPKGAAPPNYPGVNLGVNRRKAGAPAAPMGEPKKE